LIELPPLPAGRRGNVRHQRAEYAALARDRTRSRGYVVDVNAAADMIFDDYVKIKDKRLFLRDPEARAILKASLDALTNPANLKSLLAEPIIVQRRDKLPVILRIWFFEGQPRA